jgi:hypothetical protein
LTQNIVEISRNSPPPEEKPSETPHPEIKQEKIDPKSTPERKPEAVQPEISPTTLPVSESKPETVQVPESKLEKLPVLESKPENLPVPVSEPEKLPVPESKPEKLPVPERELQKLPVPESKPEKLPLPESKSEKLPVPEIKSEPVQTPSPKLVHVQKIEPKSAPEPEIISEKFVMSEEPVFEDDPEMESEIITETIFANDPSMESEIIFSNDNGELRSENSEIPDLEDCPNGSDRGISPAETPEKFKKTSHLTTSKFDSGLSGNILEEMEKSEPKRIVKKLSELAAKKTEVSEAEKPTLPEESKKPEFSPLDAVPKPETKSTKPGAKIEEIFAKLDEKSKLEEKQKAAAAVANPSTSTQNVPTMNFEFNSEEFMETIESDPSLEEAASIMASMSKKTPTQKAPSDAILSKLIGKQITKLDDNAMLELQEMEEHLDESDIILESELSLPFDVEQEIVVESEVNYA